jgi:hypothetical protein
MPKVLTEKLLAREFPVDTEPVLAYTPPSANTTTAIKSFKVCNISGSSAHFSVLFIPAGEADIDETNAIFWNVQLDADETFSDETFMSLNSGDRIYVISDSVDGLVFWFWGYEVVTS